MLPLPPVPVAQLLSASRVGIPPGRRLLNRLLGGLPVTVLWRCLGAGRRGRRAQTVLISVTVRWVTSGRSRSVASNVRTFARTASFFSSRRACRSCRTIDSCSEGDRVARPLIAVPSSIRYS